MNNPIPCQYEYREAAQHQVTQFLMAKVLTGDLDFLSNFLGHQEASAKWLCFYCLACLDRLDETFKFEGEAPQFPKRKGVNSLKECYQRYKREYMDLEPRLNTQARRAQVTQEVSFSIVGAPLADVPLDLIAPATMHVILGLTKNIYKWLLKMFSTLEQLKQDKTKGRVTQQFRQAIVDARDTAKKYVEFLKSEFKDEIHTIEGKREQIALILKEIERVHEKNATANIGRP